MDVPGLAQECLLLEGVIPVFRLPSLKGSLWITQREDHAVVNLYGSAGWGLRQDMHVRGEERTNHWSLSVHAITLQKF